MSVLLRDGLGDGSSQESIGNEYSQVSGMPQHCVLSGEELNVAVVACGEAEAHVDEGAFIDAVDSL